MTLARDWDGVERRRARPSRDIIIEVLNRFGTEYPEPENHSPELKKTYHALLTRPWPRRGTGLSHQSVVAVSILLAAFLFLLGGIFILVFLGTSLLSFLAVILWGSILFAGLLFIHPKFNINIRTKSHTFRKYPLVCKAAYQLADSSKEETVRDYLPVLRVDGKKIFQIVYIKEGDETKSPTGILLLDDQGRVLLKYGALENAKLTASISILCGHVLQQRAAHTRRSMKNVVNKQIPEAVGVLKDQEQRFSEHGLSVRWTSLMESVSVLPSALQESISILDVEEAFRKAMGYGFALEFYYEDALKLREVYLAYVKYLNSTYRRKIISFTTEAAMLIQILEGKTDWPDVEAALDALATLAVAGTNGVLSRIFQKEYEGIVDEAERRAYEEKTQHAKNMGWAVVAE